MRGKFKTLGIGLIAVLAISGAAASTAQAGQFTAENYPATITGTQLTGHKFSFANNYSVTCASAAFHGQLPEAVERLTVGARYEECESNAGDPVTIQMTGCDYGFEVAETLGENEVDGRLWIKCPDGAGIDFEDEVTGCKVKILPQNALTTLKYTNNVGAGDFVVDINVFAINYVENELCPGGAGMFFAGQYKGKSTMTGDFEGEEVGVKVD